MIIGTGIDVVEISQFAQQLAVPGTSFPAVFTARERRYARGKQPAGAALSPAGSASSPVGATSPGGAALSPLSPAGGPSPAGAVDQSVGDAPFPLSRAAERLPASRPEPQLESREVESLAVRWAAKEAFVKAWSAGLYGSAPVLPDIKWHEIEIVVDPWHRPALALHGEVAEAFARSVGEASIHVSLSHDGPVAYAQVILERN